MATNTGAATTRFPLKLPQGRQGMQPELTLQYNSEGGNGWLGLGWDLRTPSITLDTRWGVPRYSGSLETETYLLDGEMLSPVAHRSWVARQGPVRVFHTRVEGAFRKIERHGNDPTEYWWVVTDKEGTRSFYGGVSSVNDSAVLRDAQGHIAKWQLVKVLDSNNNNILYEYDIEEHAGTAGSPNMGQQIYPKKIWYTGLGEARGKYSVEFDLDAASRPDKQVNCRLGFKEVTANRLVGIRVKYNNELIRWYELGYQIGPFNKSLLDSIREYDREGDLFYAHSFEYHDDVRDGDNDYQPYKPVEVLNVPGDGVTSPLFDPTQQMDDEPTVVGATATSSLSYGGAITVGGNDNRLYSKQNTIGGSYNRSSSKGESSISFLDVNGDNLPDKVFRAGGSLLKYRPNRLNVGDPSVFGPAVDLEGASGGQLNRSKSKSKTWGIEAFPGSLFAGITWTKTESKITTYLLDRNGDGLMDINSNGLVHFNRNNGGIPLFEPTSLNTENPVTGGAIASEIQAIDPDLIDELIAENPLNDMVRVWTAPYDGVVNIAGTVTLLHDDSEEAQFYQNADGIKAFIQHNSDVLWSEVIGEDAIDPVSASVDQVSVKKFDRIFFRCSSIYDGSYDQALWSPVITYVSTDNPSFPDASDANGYSKYQYGSAEDFLLRSAQAMVMPADGTIAINSRLTKPQTTDDVIRLIIKDDPSDMLPPDTLLRDTLHWNDVLIDSFDRYHVCCSGGLAVDVPFICYNERPMDRC
ncbi:MAG: hypothetical protein IPO90_10525 [Flavobacteriales bacterium]|nr:hypothetical protein [Flavobacteriales bacterium]